MTGRAAPVPPARTARADVTRADPRTRALLAAAVVSVVAASTAPLWWRFEQDVSLLFWHGMLSGASLVAAGFVAARWRSGRPIARLVLVSGIVYFVPYVSFAPSDLAYTVGILWSGVWLTVAGHFVVAFPEGRLRSAFERRLVAVMYGWTIVSRLPIFVADFRKLGCPDCPRNLLLVHDDPALAATLLQAESLVPIVIVTAVTAVIARRWALATRPERRVLDPLFTALLVNVAAAAAVYAANALYRAGLVGEAVLEASIIVQRTTVVLIAGGLVAGVVRSVAARAGLGNLLVRVGEGRTIDSLEREVRWALGDPDARLAYRRGDVAALADTTGSPLDVSGLDPDSVTRVHGPAGSELALVHDPWLGREEPELVAAVAAAARLALENKELHAELALRGRLPRSLAERLMEEGAQIGELRRLTISVVMSDVRGYVGIAETAPPEQIANQLQAHRSEMAGVIAERKGTVMQYVGDAVFAVFGAPSPLDAHAPAAVAAAIDMHRAQSRLNEAWAAAGWEPFDLGISVTTGEVAAALLGSREHVEYSVVGDVVNLAQRIQSWARPGEVVMDEETFRRLTTAVGPVERHPLTPVKGRSAPVAAYRLRA